jgi:type IV pilus assembly protein PilE
MKSSIPSAVLFPRRARGFTLIEIMIVVAIVGVLMAIALPSYTSYVARANRADAKGQMLQVSQYMHKFYAANDRFDQNRAAATNVDGDLVPPGMMRSPSNGTQLYGLTVRATAVAFTVTAVPLTGTKMAGDACGSLTLTSTGVRGVDGATLSRDQCWK